MNKPTISIIVCIAKNRGIGKDNKLLFEISDDLKRFKKITMGYPIIMGYNTFRSIGKPLPGRINVVLYDKDINIEGCKVCHSIEDALKAAKENDNKEIFFIGGGMVYKEALNFADRLYLTLVDAKPEADTFFPDYSDFKKIVSKEEKEDNGLKYKNIILER